MPLAPSEWNAIVIGHWNRAILSPAGIAKRLFLLNDATPVQVLVPLDVVVPYHVRHENITVIPSGDRLIVEPVRPTVENLVEAIAILRRALADLPRTPVFAAGLNLKYRSTEPIDVLQQAVVTPWDDRLSDKGMVIASRSVARSVNWREGKINTTIAADQGGTCTVHLNFDYQSQEFDKLRNWLGLSAEEIREKAELILQTIGLSPEDLSNA